MPEKQRKVLESALSEHDGNDVPDEVLDAISEDEMRFDRKKQVKENNQRRSQAGAELIEAEIVKFTHALVQLQGEFTKNLQKVNEQIEAFQAGARVDFDVKGLLQIRNRTHRSCWRRLQVGKSQVKTRAGQMAVAVDKAGQQD